MSETLEHSLKSPRPVSRWIWPGLLFVPPGFVIVASVISAFFLVGRPEGLVASDYYKQGKAINAQLAKLAHARTLGLDSVAFERTSSGLIATFPRAASQTGLVEFVFAHPVDESLDVRRTVTPTAAGAYEIALDSAFVERRRVIINDASHKQWRVETLLER
jgi:uncharacterized protein